MPLETHRHPPPVVPGLPITAGEQAIGSSSLSQGEGEEEEEEGEEEMEMVRVMRMMKRRGDPPTMETLLSSSRLCSCWSVVTLNY